MKIHSTENEKIVYVINHDSFDKAGSIEISTEGFKAKSITNIISNEKVGFTIKDEIIKIDVTIPQNESLVLLIKK